MKILENCQEYVYSYLFIELLNAKILRLNFSEEIFWTILQLWSNENIRIILIKRNVLDWESIKKNWFIWNIWFLKYLIPFPLYLVSILVLSTMNTLSPLFWGINSNNLFLFCLKDIEKMLQYFFSCLFVQLF